MLPLKLSDNYLLPPRLSASPPLKMMESSMMLSLRMGKDDFSHRKTAELFIQRQFIFFSMITF
jgi:hypothetical protein